MFDAFDALVGLLAGELDKAVTKTLAERSATPGREFATRVIDTDLAVSSTSHDVRAGVLGQSVAFFLVARWITAMRRRGVRPEPEPAALEWVARHLGDACTDAASRALASVGTPRDEPKSMVGDLSSVDLLPALVWLVSGLVAAYGDGDSGRMRQFLTDFT